MQNKKIRVWSLLFLIVALGFFLRIYRISSVPPGVYPDEAVNGMDAISANNSGHYQWFYPANQGREGLMMNLVALCFKLFGISMLSLILPSIIAGALTVLGIFLLSRELFNNRVGLISAFLVAVSFWPLNFSRISFRANLLPAILVFSFYFLFLGLRTKKWWPYIIGGFVFGIGMHTYIAWRIAPLILILLLVFVILSRKNYLKENWGKILVFLATSIIAAAPMFWTFYAHPEYFESRSDSISIFSPKINNGHPILTFLRSFGLSLAKYNFWGDQNWRHNYPPYPILDYVTGIAFLFGLIFALIKFFKLSWYRWRYKIQNSELEVYALLVFWFFIMLVPEFMTAEGNPHALRSIGTLPAVFLLAALTFEFIYQKIEKYNYSFKKITHSILLIAIIFIGAFNILKYHVFWAGKTETARAFEKVDMDVSDYLKTLPHDKEIYVITGAMQRIPMQVFNQENQNINYIYPGQLDWIQPKNPANLIVIMTEKNDDAINALQSRFPNLKFSEHSEKVQEYALNFYVLE